MNASTRVLPGEYTIGRILMPRIAATPPTMLLASLRRACRQLGDSKQPGELIP